MNVLDLVKSMSQPTTSASTGRDVQNIHDILGQGPYTGGLSNMQGHVMGTPLSQIIGKEGNVQPMQPSNAHENIDAEIQQNGTNSLLNSIIEMLSFPMPSNMSTKLDTLLFENIYGEDARNERLEKYERHGKALSQPTPISKGIEGLLDYIIPYIQDKLKESYPPLPDEHKPRLAVDRERDRLLKEQELRNMEESKKLHMMSR